MKYMFLNKNFSVFLTNLLVFMTMFLTTKSFYVFYGMIFLIVMLLILFIRKRSIDYIYVSLFFICCLCFSYRATYFSNVEDFKELIKFVIFVILIWLSPKVSPNYFFKVAFLFSFTNCIFSFLQFIHFDLNGIVSLLSKIYNTDHHIDASLSYLVPRALGFSAGPGQQAVISLFFIAYFSVVTKYSKHKKLLPIVGVMLCLITLIMTQSKTAILALPISLVIFYLSCFRMFSIKFSITFIFILLSSISLLFLSLDMIFNTLPELQRVYENGLNVSSFQSRIINWKLMYSPVIESNNIVFYLLGIGRSGLEYYKVNDIPYDSDYLYFLINFGFFGLITFLLFLISSLLYPLINRSSSPKVMFFSLLASFALVVSFSLNLIVEPRIYILLALLLCFDRRIFYPR